MPLPLHSTAPDFSLPSTDGTTVKLSGIGQPLILFFYPKSFTPGCTAEACGFRNEFQEFANAGVKVLGITKDDLSTLTKFRDAHGLPYPLLSDRQGSVAQRYGALVPFIGVVKRISYLLDSDRKVLAVFNDFFLADAHVRSMLQQVRQQAI